MNQNTKIKRLRIGLYTAIVTVLAVGVLVVLNLLVGSLPSTYTKFDTSIVSYYDLGEQTQTALSAISEDVDVYLIAEEGSRNTVIDELLARYQALCGRIRVTYVDPAFQPTFVSKYTDETLSQNSLIVQSARRYRIVRYEDIFLSVQVPNYETYTYDTKTTFNGEAAITGALNFVTCETVPTIYMTANHEEFNFSDTLAADIEYGSFALFDLDMAESEDIPQDCTCLVINSPSQDFTEQEIEQVRRYLERGGKVIFVSPMYKVSTPRLFALMAECGAVGTEGVIQDSDANYFLSGYPTILTPDLEDSPILDRTGSGIYTAMYLAHGIQKGQSDGWTYTPLMTTSKSARIEGEDTVYNGPFQVAAMMQNTVGGTVVWFTTPYMLLDELDTNYASGGNSVYFLTTLDYLCDKAPSASISAKEMQVAALHMTSASSTLWSILLIGVLPLCIIGVGFLIWRRRKNR